MGLGFKDFTAGDPLTAAQVDGYLMRQSNMVFASTSARDTALSGNLEQGMIAITTDTMTLVNSTTTGTRSLAQNGIATAIKVSSTGWIIAGWGLT